MLTNRFIEEALAGEVVVNIGQVTDKEKRELDKLVKLGVLAKWRGHWHPLPGANFGLGPPKTCWGLPEYRESPLYNASLWQ